MRSACNGQTPWRLHFALLALFEAMFALHWLQGTAAANGEAPAWAFDEARVVQKPLPMLRDTLCAVRPATHRTDSVGDLGQTVRLGKEWTALRQLIP